MRISTVPSPARPIAPGARRRAMFATRVVARRGGIRARTVLTCAAHLVLALFFGCGAPPPFEVGAVEYRGPAGSSAPALAVAGTDLLMSFTEPTPDGRHAVRIARRSDAGWRVVATPVENDSLFVNWADFPSVTVLANGRWVAHWLQKTAASAYAYHVRMAISADEGTTWSAPFSPHGDRSATEHGFVATVPFATGAALVWLDGRNTSNAAEGEHGAGGAMTLRFTTLDSTGVPYPDIELDGRVCDCCQTDLARTSSGLVVVYRDRSEGEIRDIAVARWVDGTWFPSQKVSEDGWHYPGCPVNGPAVAAMGDTVAVAWYTAANSAPAVYAAFSTDGGDTFGSRIRIDEGRPTGRVDLVALGDGEAAVSWIEETDTDGEIRLRRVGLASGAGPSQVVAPTETARAAGFPRMARFGNVIALAWTDVGGDGGVRVMTVRVPGGS